MSQSLSTQGYKGTRDFYPEEMRVRRWIFEKIRKALISCGYEEYDGPLLEPFELYAAKTSEEIVNEQLYWLMDRGQRKLAIRPEMTPTLARMVAAKQNELPKPLRWFSIPNLWRYERPQRGRLREHWQLNVDVFGGSAGAEDLEILSLITVLMEEFKATPQSKTYEVRLNHRGLINEVFEKVLKIPSEKVARTCQLLDGALKMGSEVFLAKLKEEGMTAFQTEFLQGLLAPDAPQRIERELKDSESLKHLIGILASLKALGIEAPFRFDPAIMRGFQYYTGLVFEVFDLHPENNRALFGGGRYDNLVGLFGGKNLPGVGFGMGDVTFKNFLEVHGLLPEVKRPPSIYFSALDEALLVDAQRLAFDMRRKLKGNFSVLCGLESEKVKKAFVSAERLGARYVLFVGSNEIQTKVFSGKDLVKGIPLKGSLDEIIDLLGKED